MSNSRITEVTASYKRTLNLGDYENAVYEMTITVEVDPDEGAETASRAAWDFARSEVAEAARPVLEARSRLRIAALRNDIAGLPKHMREQAARYLAEMETEPLAEHEPNEQ